MDVDFFPAPFQILDVYTLFTSEFHLHLQKKKHILNIHYDIDYKLGLDFLEYIVSNHNWPLKIAEVKHERRIFPHLNPS